MPPASSSSSAYSFKPGGSLKFKGGDSPSSIKKKKKKSRSSTSQDLRKGESSTNNEIVLVRDDSREPDDDNLKNSNDDNKDESEWKTPSGRIMTDAERKFEMIRRKRMEERVKKQAKLSHKDRVDAFNRDLESRTEHFEMGRVGGGG